MRSGDYLACAAARKMGTCDNGRGIPRAVLEEFILDNVKNEVSQPMAFRNERLL